MNLGQNPQILLFFFERIPYQMGHIEIGKVMKLGVFGGHFEGLRIYLR